MECYNCDIKEHYARECHKLRKSQSITAIKWGPEGIKWWVLTIILERNSDLSTLSQRSININDQHKSMSWTACYDDIYQTH